MHSGNTGNTDSFAARLPDLLLKYADTITLDCNKLAQPLDLLLLRRAELPRQSVLLSGLSPELADPVCLLDAANLCGTSAAVFCPDESIPVIR